MSHLTRFSSNTLNDLFGQMGSPAYFIRPLHGESLPTDFKVDINENKHSFNIKAQIPGVKKEDINISVDGPLVTIQAHIKQLDEKTEDDKVVRSECYYGTTSRSFQLPVEVDASGTKASYENGVLQLQLPKKVGGSVKQIKVT